MLTLPIPKGIGQAYPNPYQKAQALVKSPCQIGIGSAKEPISSEKTYHTGINSAAILIISLS